MDCAGVYVECDDNCSVYNETNPTAIKHHKCSECKREIVPGEKYYRAFGVWDGIAQTYKTCLDCKSIIRAFFSNSWIHSEMLCSLQEFMNEAEGVVSIDCFAELTPAAKDMVYKIMDRTFELLDD